MRHYDFWVTIQVNRLYFWVKILKSNEQPVYDSSSPLIYLDTHGLSVHLIN